MKKKQIHAPSLINQNRFVKLLLVADNHGQLIDHEAEERLFTFKRSWRPNITIHLGDCYNFDALRKGATPPDMNMDMGVDVGYANAFLERLRPNYYLMGNHDWRTRANIEHPNAVIRYACQTQIDAFKKMMERLKVEVYDWGVRPGVLELYGQRYIHGYSQSANARTKRAFEVYGPVVQGHGHTPELVFNPSYNGGMSMTLPSMCNNAMMEYQRGQYASLGHMTGWGLAIADTHTNRTFLGMMVRDNQTGQFIVMEPKVLS